MIFLQDFNHGDIPLMPVLNHGVAWLSMVRRGSEWCGVAQNSAAWLSMYGAAWLSMVRHGSVWCCVAQYAAWLSW